VTILVGGGVIGIWAWGHARALGQTLGRAVSNIIALDASAPAPDAVRLLLLLSVWAGFLYATRRGQWSRLWPALARTRQFTWRAVASVGWRLGSRFGIYGGGLAAAEYYSDGATASYEWGVLFSVAACVAVLDFLKDAVTLSRRTDEASGSRITLKLLTGTIDDWTQSQTGTLDAYMSRLLPRIEGSVAAALSYHGIHGTVTANLMLVRGDDLVLEHWGTRGDGRENIRLPLGQKASPVHGAPTAYWTRALVYIPDTQAPEFATAFSADRPYRSILCLPIPFTRGRGTAPRAVLNLDSTEVDGFGTDPFVLAEIMPCLHPWLSLLALEQRLR
jgi:hypothetical protein